MIVEEMPWCCGERDCPVQWHLSCYSFDEKTNEPIVSNYADGDWEPCDEIPDPDEVAKAWKEYHLHVATTGLDPLKQFAVNTVRKAKHQWQVKYRNWVGSSQRGLLCVGARRRGRGEWITPDKLPEAVQQYLLLEKGQGANPIYCTPDFKSFDELSKAEGVANARLTLAGLTAYVEVEEEQPVAPDRIAKELKRAARKALADTN